MKRPRSENAIDYTGDNFAFAKNAPVRLVGADMEMLRLKRFQMDKSRCCECRQSVSDSLPKWHPKKAHLAHVISRGAGGPDTIENTRTLCGEDHRRQHAGETLRCMEEARAQLIGATV